MQRTLVLTVVVLSIYNHFFIFFIFYYLLLNSDGKENHLLAYVVYGKERSM